MNMGGSFLWVTFLGATLPGGLRWCSMFLLQWQWAYFGPGLAEGYLKGGPVALATGPGGPPHQLWPLVTGPFVVACFPRGRYRVYYVLLLKRL